MDILKPEGEKEKLAKRRKLYIGGTIAAVVLIVAAAWLLKPSGPVVAKDSVWIGVAKEGPLVLGIDGTGNLRPEVARVISALTAGRVEKILERPGSAVNAATPVLVLSSPEVEQAARDADWQARAARADLQDFKAGLDSQLMDLKAKAAEARAAYTEARVTYDANKALEKDGLVSKVSLTVYEARAEAAKTVDESQQARVESFQRGMEAKTKAQEARCAQIEEQASLKRQQADALNVPAGIDGILQEVSVEVGQQVAAGAALAKVVQPGRLKAMLKVSARQAKYLERGQEVEIDTHEGIVQGSVVAFDPSVQQGMISVDVALKGEIPSGVRPDQSVEGTIILERKPYAVFIPRPALAEPESAVFLFKVDGGGKGAKRVKVALGKGSAKAMEVLSGLKPGDEVILSDMSAYEKSDRISLH
jgi:HlyD family secretion protein